MLCRLLLNLEDQSEFAHAQLVNAWYKSLIEIPTGKLEACYLIASTLGPKRYVFGPWDLIEPWRQNMRMPNGQLVRGVSI